MKKLAMILAPIGALLFAGSLVVGGAALFVTVLTAGDVAYGLPMVYFEKLNFPMLSIALPAAGIVILLLALPGLLERRQEATASNVIELTTKPVTPEGQQPETHLKAA